MKLRSIACIRIVGKPEPGEYQGNKTYRLNILTDDGAGDIRCTEDAYVAVGPVDDRIIPVNAELLYNSEYKSMSVTRIWFPEKRSSGNQAADKPAGK